MKFNYERRKSTVCRVGGVLVGGDNPIAIQSMTNTDTNDVEGSVAQIKRIAEEGADIVRLTTQGKREVQSLAIIKTQLQKEGYLIPLVADVHFSADVADEAAKITDKVRINPGNYVDPGRKFKLLTYTDEEYAGELKKIRQRFIPLLDLCRLHHTAIRLGVNHGSLSDRIMSRYGDTPEGIVESCMEFLRIAKEQDFDDIVISVKASNPAIMVCTLRRLVDQMDREGMKYPLHLGVTEAGGGEDGRIKSAVGIGALLNDGIGDTIRVSLSEAPEHEVPVARQLVDYITKRASAPNVIEPLTIPPSLYSPYNPTRFCSEKVGKLGGGQPVCVCGGTPVGADVCIAGMFNYSLAELNSDESILEYLHDHPQIPVIARSNGHNPIGVWRAYIMGLRIAGCKNPIVISRDYSFCQSWEEAKVCAAADFGVMLIDKMVDGICIQSEQATIEQRVALAFAILQATRARITRTEYIACPSCGRTLFDLESTLAEIQAATRSLPPGLKIGVMGCIVNGPGEMADADYGYVGAGPDHVSLYRGKECVEKNIPATEAVAHLLALIEADQKKA